VRTITIDCSNMSLRNVVIACYYYYYHLHYISGTLFEVISGVQQGSVLGLFILMYSLRTYLTQLTTAGF
jgi:hypothetical protein